MGQQMPCTAGAQHIKVSIEDQGRITTSRARDQEREDHCATETQTVIDILQPLGDHPHVLVGDFIQMVLFAFKEVP